MVAIMERKVPEQTRATKFDESNSNVMRQTNVHSNHVL
jgi:hypothetical protein